MLNKRVTESDDWIEGNTKYPPQTLMVGEEFSNGRTDGVIIGNKNLPQAMGQKVAIPMLNSFRIRTSRAKDDP